MKALACWWRRWSPWHLREALRVQARWASDDRAILSDDYANTAIERLFRHADFAYQGDPDPQTEALRYRVKGATLCVDLPRVVA